MTTYWHPVDAGVWRAEYPFRSNVINNLVVDMGDGKLMSVSPGIDTSEEAFDALDELGTVTAIVSPGAFHNLGFPRWHARYPEAGLYAVDSGIAHINKQHSGLPELEGLEALRAVAGDQVALYECPSKKFGDLLLFVTRGDNVTMFSNECLGNQPNLPSSFVFRLLFRLTNSGPGLKYNNLASKLLGANTKEVKAFMLDRIGEHGVTRFVPCHGDVLDGADVRQRIEAALA